MKYLIALAVVSIALLWALTGTEDHVNQIEQHHYCEMVKLWKQTGGAYGWPDYKRVTCDKGE